MTDSEFTPETPENMEVQGVARYFPPRLTKREHFAAMVLQGIMSREWSDMDLACEQAVNAADKLIKKLNQ